MMRRHDVPSFKQQATFRYIASKPRDESIRQMELCLAADVSPRFDSHILARSLTHVLRRHQELRSSFRLQDEDLVVESLDLRAFDLQTKDLTSVSPAAVRGVIDAEIARGFPALGEPLLRLTLLLTEGDRNVILLQVHHIVADGWSLEIIFRDLMTSYLAGGVDLWKAGVAPRFEDYVDWEEDFVHSPVGVAHHAYWLSKLSAMTGPLALPFRQADRSRSDERALLEFSLDAEVCAGLVEFARRHSISRFAVLLGLLGLTLNPAADRRIMPISIPVARRNRREHMELVGDVAQTIYVGLETSLRDDPVAYFQAISHELETAMSHQDYPIRRVTSEIHAASAPGAARVNDQIAFGMMTPEKNDALGLGRIAQGANGRKIEILGYSVEFLELGRVGCPRELCIRCQADDTRILFQIAYDTSLYAAAAIHDMAQAYQAQAARLMQDAGMMLAPA